MRNLKKKKNIAKNKNALTIVVAAVLLFGLAGYVAAQSVGGSNTFYVKSAVANIRSCKSASCKIIGKLNHNAKITMQTRSTLRDLPQWIKISFKKGNKRYTGYISKTVLAALTSRPALSQGTTSDTTPQNPNSPPYTSPALSEVFSDDFSGVFPGNKWIYTNNPGFTQDPPQIDASIGNPAPSLAVPFPKASNINLSGPTITTDVNPFNSANGFSVSVDVRQPDTSPEGSYSGTWIRDFKFTIKHLTNQYAYAYIEISPHTGDVNYGIYRAYVGGGGSYVTAPYMPDANFHNFKFVVDEYGNAKWYRDGMLKNSFSEFPVGDYIISMSANGRSLPMFSTSTARYFHNVDNVRVTTP